MNDMNSKGYIAVTSALIIAVVLMALIFSVSYTGFLNRFNILDTYFKEASREMAEACVVEAMSELAADPDYAGDEVITLGTDTCNILAIEDVVPGSSKRISTKSTIKMAVTNLKVVINIPSLTVVSWEEVPNF